MYYDIFKNYYANLQEEDAYYIDVNTDVIEVSVDGQAYNPNSINAPIPCFIASHVQFSERAKEYNSLDEVTADGFATTSNVYKAASKYFSQEVAVDKIIIGRRQVDVATLTPTVANSAAYSFKLNGTTTSKPPTRS